MAKTPFKRVLLKMSGEMLAGNQGFGIDRAMIQRFAKEIKDIRDMGIEVAVVIKIAKIWRVVARVEMLKRCTPHLVEVTAVVANQQGRCVSEPVVIAGSLEQYVKLAL